MSRLGILGIRGIRSYSNYDKDSEDITLKVIDFSKGPVTLILGENGCGKTVSIFLYLFFRLAAIDSILFLSRKSYDLNLLIILDHH